MANHKCGSCHFFQEAGLAASGWCHHPQRKVSSGVLIMVRRNELACRDAWSRDLWQPRDATEGDGVRPTPGPLPGPLAPAMVANLQSMLDRGLSPATSPAGEDVLLSEGRIVSDSREEWEPETRPFPAGNFDPRTALFRAREAYRGRARAKAAAERHSAGVEPIADAAVTRAILDATVDSPTGEPSPLRSPQTAVAGGVTGPEMDSHQNGPNSGEPNARKIVVSEPGVSFSDETGWIAEAADVPVTGFEPSRDEHREEDDPLSEPGRRIEVEPPEVEADYLAPGPAEVTVKEAFPDWYRSDLPRVCRTCRDYRPSVDGQRGWCANTWAFTHRRVVLEDDLAPCQSAIGDWWLPVDDIWMVAADVAAHGRPTPLLDRLTAKAEQHRRRS